MFNEQDVKNCVLPKFRGGRQSGKYAAIGNLVLTGKAIAICGPGEKWARRVAKWFVAFGLGLINAKVCHEEEDDHELWFVYLTKKKGGQ